MKRILFVIFLLIPSTTIIAQVGHPSRSNSSKSAGSEDINYLNPREYIVAGITVKGTQFLDNDALITISKLTRGERIVVPGEATSNAIKNLWAQDLLDDVGITVTKIKSDSIYLEISVVERPRLSRIDIKGLRKGQVDDIHSKLDSRKGKVVNQNLLNTISEVIKKYFHEKGYLNTEVTISQKKDTTEVNNLILIAEVNKHRRTIVNRITFEGNQKFTDSQLRRFLKKTGQRAFYKIFGPGKFVQNKYEESKEILISKLKERGYKDAEILEDTVRRYDDKMVDIHIKIHEGPRYFFGDIAWVGNARYTTSFLNELLGIEKGEVFSDQKLEKKLKGGGPSGNDISSQYMNNGYLTFNIDPVHTKIYGDTVDLELRIYEGPQYTINRVTVKGNELTNDKVILRELRTRPGQKFSKEDIVRSVREIAQLGNFDDQKTDPRPININPKDGTVDIEYTVVEKPSDQLELSGGVGGGRVIGTLGLTFNNFSMRNMFNAKAWRPLPKGDGQKLSIKGQSDGRGFQSYNLTFSEPWLGGKKPIDFTVNLNSSMRSNGLASDNPDLERIRSNGMTFSLGQRLNFPDDFFQIRTSISFQQYRLNNYRGFIFPNGTSYNFSLTQEISRNSLDALFYPTSGSNLRLTLQATPPYSLLNRINYLTATDQEKYRFTEFYKLKFESQWFQRIYGKLVLKTQAQFGFLGYYNKAVGLSPFERFTLGGDMMQGISNLQGSEIVTMRGYPNNSVIPIGGDIATSMKSGNPVFSKYILELRHPIIESQQASIYILAFAEGGNTWSDMREFTPFDIRRSVGVGVRVFLPIFGMVGLDYGYGFDKIYFNNVLQQAGGRWQFTIGQPLGGFN